MKRRIVIFVALAILCALGSVKCGESPSDPTFDCVDSIPVLLNDPAYTARTETIESMPVRLTKDCSRNSRYCYYLSDSSVGVYTAGNQTILDPYVGDLSTITGRVVYPNGTAPGEVWPGTICRLTH